MLSVKNEEQEVSVGNRFTDCGDGARFIFVRFSEIFYLKRAGQTVFLALSVGFNTAERRGDFGESARAGKPEPAIAGESHAGKLLKSSLIGNSQDFSAGVLRVFGIKFHESVWQEEQDSALPGRIQWDGNFRALAALWK